MEVIIKGEWTMGGNCYCGTSLPNVLMTETPYQFCSKECKKVHDRFWCGMKEI